MQHPASGPGAETRVSKALGESSTINMHFFPGTHLTEHIREKAGEKNPRYGVSNKLRNFFDFHDVHMAVNFNVML